MADRVKIAVCVPWASPFIWTRFSEAALQVRAPAGTEIQWVFGKGWCPARRHTDAIEKALDWGADLVCIFGADQIAPPDLLERLYARFLEGKQVVCALVPSRGFFGHNVGTKPFQPLAWKWKSLPVDESGNPVWRDYRGQEQDGDMIEVIKADGEVHQVHMIGSGCLMFHRDHILSLARPWFTEAVDPKTYRRFANMDTRFAWRLIVEAAATIWCDTSIKILHLTDMAIDETFQDRFDDWMEPGKSSEPQIIQPKGAEVAA